MDDRSGQHPWERPRGWSRKPGDPPVVGWLASAPTPKVVLPESWAVRWIWDLAAVSEIDESIDVVVADPRGAGPAAFQRRLQHACEAQQPIGRPEILLVRTPASEAWAGKYGARILPRDGRPRPRAIHEEASQPLLRWLAERLLTADDDSGVVRQFVQYGLLQRIPDEPDAVEVLSSGGAPYVRTVSQMLNRLGCGRSWLYTYLPFHPGKALKAFTFIHGLIIYCRVPLRRAGHRWVTPWSSVASRLGFRDPTGWTHFCDEVVGVAPRRLPERTLGEWIETALHGLGLGLLGGEAASRGRRKERGVVRDDGLRTKLLAGQNYRASIRDPGLGVTRNEQVREVS